MLRRLAILVVGVFIAAQVANAETVDPIIVGEADAPIKIDVYTSPTCSICKKFHENNIEGIKDRYIDRGYVQLRIHDIYTSPEALSFLSSVLFRCVYDRDGYERYSAIKTDYYASFQKFAKSQDLQADFLSLGAQYGFDEAAMTACSNRQDLRGIVQAAAVQAAGYKVTLPVLVVNGELFNPKSTTPLMKGEHEIQDAIDRLLNDRLVDDPDLAERNAARDQLMSIEIGIEYLDRDLTGDVIELRNSTNWNKFDRRIDGFAYLGTIETREKARGVLADIQAEYGDSLDYQIDFFETREEEQGYRMFILEPEHQKLIPQVCDKLDSNVISAGAGSKCIKNFQVPLP